MDWFSNWKTKHEDEILKNILKLLNYKFMSIIKKILSHVMSYEIWCKIENNV